MKKWFISFVLLLSMVFISMPFQVFAEENQTADQTCVNEKVIKLKYNMQKLWIEHAWWTRSLIVSRLANLDDQDKVLERLLQNQVDLGNLIKPYYGEEAGNQLTALLKEHIVIAGKIIDAAKIGDEKNVNKYNKEWVKNADDIVLFLTNANPNYSKKELTEMFYTHLKLTIDEVVYRLQKDWDRDIKAADANEEHLIMMGDMLTDGIVKQFPQKLN